MVDTTISLKLNKYSVGKTLGEGIFKVKHVYDPITQEQYAAKICKESWKKHLLLKEASILSQLNQANIPNIVKMKELIEPEQISHRRGSLRSTTAQNADSYQYNAAIIMELVPNQSLFEYVCQSKGLEEKLARSYFKDLITTVHSLHSLGYVHRDIKLENILIDQKYHIKLADFGFARSFDEFSKEKMTTRLGTEYYMAPEIKQSDFYSGVKIDVFACGVILFLMILGRPPFRQASSVDPLYRHFTDENPEKFWSFVEQKLSGGKEIKASLKVLINDLLARDPEKRPTADEILEYEWVQREFCTDEELETLMSKKKKTMEEEEVN